MLTPKAQEQSSEKAEAESAISGESRMSRMFATNFTRRSHFSDLTISTLSSSKQVTKLASFHFSHQRLMAAWTCTSLNSHPSSRHHKCHIIHNSRVLESAAPKASKSAASFARRPSTALISSPRHGQEGSWVSSLAQLAFHRAEAGYSCTT